MALDLKPLIDVILDGYALPRHGTHGVAHWARALENGLRLAEATGVNGDVVSLFAVLHDSRRVNEGRDHGHGRRGAELAARLRRTLIKLSDEEFELLYDACVRHTEGGIDADPTVQVCWDADRLDLGRVGVTPDPARLCTEIAKTPHVLKWANERATSDFVPALVDGDWELDGIRPRRPGEADG